eukprot:m.237896 g.237896  ORF g.237896 m.237896 type:complete len:668 (-) comp15800_c2_seq1:384-2387(-)
MPAIRFKFKRIAAVCAAAVGCACLAYRASRPAVINPLDRDLDLGVPIPSRIEELQPPVGDDEAAESFISAFDGQAALPAAVFAARLAEKVAFVDERLHNNVDVTTARCSRDNQSGEAERLCVLARVLLDWADRDWRTLGCALGMARLYDITARMMPSAKQRPLFERYGWCSPNGVGVSGLSTEACAVAAHAADSFALLARKADDFLELRRDRMQLDASVDGINVGTLCMRWSAGYSIRLANTILSKLNRDASGLSPPHIAAMARGLSAINSALTFKPLTSADTVKVFEQMEHVLKDSELLGMVELAANHRTPLRPSAGPQTTHPPLGVSMRHLLRHQRARVSPGPLSLASTVQLNSGAKMPLIGLGTGYGDCFVARDGSWRIWESDKGIESVSARSMLELVTKTTICELPTPEFVATAIVELGIRMVDTAALYGSEQRTFAGVRQATSRGIARENIFVMTKAWPPRMLLAGVVNELHNGARGIHLPTRIEDGGLEYVDLYCEHHAFRKTDQEWRGKFWHGMVHLQSMGYTRSLGVSEEWNPGADIIQERFHPASASRISCRFSEGVEPIMLELITRNVTVVNLGVVLDASRDPLIRHFAAKKGVSPFRYAVRWSLQMGMPLLAMSTSINHLKEDVNAFNFEIAEDEMTLIDLLLQCGTADEVDGLPM